MFRYGATHHDQPVIVSDDVERLIPNSCDTSFADEDADESIIQDKTSTRRDWYLNGLLLITAVLVSVAVVSTYGPTRNGATNDRPWTLSSPVITKKNNFMGSKAFQRVPYAATATGLSVSTVWNEYGEFGVNGMVAYPFLSGSFLVEPYKETTVNVQGVVEGCTYTYTVTSVKDSTNTVTGTMELKTIVDSNLAATGVSGEIKLILSKVGEYTMVIGDSCNTGDSLTQNLWVKYVRREVSTLTDTDREEFLDAFHTLWEVNTVDGMAKYGERYKSLHYFAALHNDGGGNSVCDEFHGGVGFLNNHMYLSAYLEQSMQLVNPKVCLHYIEYTQYFESDGFKKHLTNELDGGGWTELLTAKYFGANDPVSGRITDGRWAMTPIPYVTSEFFTNHGIKYIPCSITSFDTSFFFNPPSTFLSTHPLNPSLKSLSSSQLPTIGINEEETFFPVEQKIWVQLTNPHLNSPYGTLQREKLLHPSMHS